MKNKLSILSAAVLGLMCLAGAARAELVLSGSTAGYFQGSSSGSTVVNNAWDGSTASYRTGVPVNGSFKSGVEYLAASFNNVHSGDSFDFGFITYYNGRTQVGTSSSTAMFDFYLDLSDPDWAPFKLTTITFGIDATVNTLPMLQPDVFTASFTQPAPVLIGDQWVKFTINDLPATVSVTEDTWLSVANVTVTYFSPVPEPATFGIFGAVSLLGLAAYRRHRAKKTGLDLSSLSAA